MVANVVIDFDNVEDYEDALAVPNASEHISGQCMVSINDVNGCHKMRSDYIKVRHQDGSTDRFGERGNCEIVTCF